MDYTPADLSPSLLAPLHSWACLDGSDIWQCPLKCGGCCCCAKSHLRRMFSLHFPATLLLFVWKHSGGGVRPARCRFSSSSRLKSEPEIGTALVSLVRWPPPRFLADNTELCNCYQADAGEQLASVPVSLWTLVDHRVLFVRMELRCCSQYHSSTYTVV